MKKYPLSKIKKNIDSGKAELAIAMMMFNERMDKLTGL